MHILIFKQTKGLHEKGCMKEQKGRKERKKNEERKEERKEGRKNNCVLLFIRQIISKTV